MTGVNIVADRHSQALANSFMVFPVQEGDAFYQPVQENTYISNITIPAIIGKA